MDDLFIELLLEMGYVLDLDKFVTSDVTILSG